MLYLISLFLKAVFFFMMKTLFYLSIFYLMGALISLSSYPQYKKISLLMLTILSLSFLLSFIIHLYITLVIMLLSSLFLFFSPIPSRNSISFNFWDYMFFNMKLLIKMWQMYLSFNPFHSYPFARNLIYTLLFSLWIILFWSQKQLMALILLTFLALTTALFWFSSYFFFFILSSSYKNFPSTLTPQSLPCLLKSNSANHPLNAFIEETFYEKNLQMGDFYIAYPLFFKVNFPNHMSTNYESETLRLWHTLRWESAFSKRQGSATLRWSNLSNSFFSPYTPKAYNYIHIMMIPIYSDQMFNSLTQMNMPIFDPFSQPSNWSPHQILMSYLKWPETDQMETRINEMEEED